MTDDWNFDDAQGLPSEPESGAPYFIIDGDKGSGTTTTYLSFGGEQVIFSLEGKVHRIIAELRAQGVDTSRFHVYDVSRMYKTGEREIMASAVDCHDRMVNILGRVAKKGGVDWVVFDGLDIIARMEEYRMRYKAKLPLFSGVEWQFWNWRNFGMSDLLTAARAAVKPTGAVCATFYWELQDVIVGGKVVDTVKKRKKWLGKWEKENDVWLTTSRVDRLMPGKAAESKFYVTVFTSKLRTFPTGKQWDVTGTTLGEKLGPEAFHFSAEDLVREARTTVAEDSVATAPGDVEEDPLADLS
ncbi:MAG: hypothetical protein KGI98_15665 [Euryarchaeota archaeon]|nr:hypothetical protein [Euryarchaeota archaeon]MDE1879472.1 hypothetical protein [Euryarchaeota archaeon]